MKYFNFKRLIKKYNTNFIVEYAKVDKPYNPNDYDVLGKEINPYVPFVRPEEGAIIPMADKVIYQSGGRLNSSDRQLYSLNHDIPKKSKIKYKGEEYHVEAKVSYEDFADFTLYTLKAVDRND